MITKLAMNMEQLTDVYRRVAVPKIRNLPELHPFASVTEGGPMRIMLNPGIKRFEALLQNKIPSINYLGLPKKITSVKKNPYYSAAINVLKQQLEEINKTNSIIKGKPFKRRPGRLPDIHIDQAILGNRNLNPILNDLKITKDPLMRQTIRKIFNLHEISEGKVGNRLGRLIKKLHKDINTPTGHFSPSVLLDEHNAIASLEVPEAFKQEVIANMRKLRGANKVPSSEFRDLDVLDKVLKPFGGYGTGQKISKATKKNLINKIREAYETKVSGSEEDSLQQLVDHNIIKFL